MGGFRLAALVGVALAVGVCLGVWIADRSHMNGRDAGGADQKAVTPGRTLVSARTRSTQNPSAVRDVLRGGKPRAAPRVPAPKLSARSPEEAPMVDSHQPWFKELLNEGTNKLTRERVDLYLRENKRNAGSLLAAARITENPAFLREAVQNFPRDPRVLLDWLLRGAATPTERRQALDAFRQVAPQNALADYLSALNHFENGDVDDALRSLWQAADKTCMDAYVVETLQDIEEAYVAAGYSRPQAMLAAALHQPVSSQLYALHRRMLDLREQYALAGDQESTQVVGEMGLWLGSQIQAQRGSCLNEELLGMAIERHFLEQLDPGAILDAGGQTVSDRLKELEQRLATIRSFNNGLQGWTLEELDVVSFFERAKLFGEFEARCWRQSKFGNAGTAP